MRKLFSAFSIFLTVQAFSTENEHSTSKQVEARREISVPKAKCCPGAKILRDQSYPKLLNCRSGGETCFKNLEQELLGFDLQGCDLPPDARSALAVLFADDSVATEILRNRPIAKFRRGPYEMSDWKKKLMSSTTAEEANRLRQAFLDLQPKEIKDPEEARQARLFVNAALLKKESLRLREEAKNLRQQLAQSQKNDSPHSISYLSNALSKEAYAEFYEAGIQRLSSNQISLSEPYPMSLSALESKLIDAKVPLPRRISQSGLAVGIDPFAATLSTLGGLRVAVSPSGRDMVQSKVSMSRGLNQTSLDSFDTANSAQPKQSKIQDLENAWRDVENGRDPAGLGVLVKNLNHDGDLNNHPTFCALRAYADQRDTAFNLEAPVPLFRKASPSTDQAWRSADGRDKFTKHTQQQESGDASCLGHSIAAVLQTFPSVKGVDPYKVNAGLEGGQFGTSPDLAENLHLVSRNPQWANGNRITSFKMIQNASGKKLELNELKELVDRNQFPIVTLHTQARIQREDWIEPIQSPMQHAAVVIGYGNAYDPFTGKNENYVLLRDSFSRQGYPVKMRADVFQDQLVRAAVIERVNQ